jgi:predicted transcriptional regulator
MKGVSMFHKVQSVKPLHDYNLFITFQDGSTKLYDVKPLFYQWDVFKDLTTITGLFEQVAVDAGGYGIVWSDNIDLSCDELWENGESVSVNKIDPSELTLEEQEDINRGLAEYEAGKCIDFEDYLRSRFVSSAPPLPDEIEAIKMAKEELACGKVFTHEEVWGEL